MLITLADLRTQARQRADMVNSRFISDSELTGYINASAFDLYNQLVQTVEDYETVNQLFTVLSTAPYIPLPSNFFKLRGLDYSADGGATFQTVRRFNFAERNRRQSGAFIDPERYAPVYYRIVASQILFTPEDNAAGVYQLWFVPEFTPLVNDTDTFNGHNGFQEYIILDSAIKCLAKEESDTRALEMQKARVEAKIGQMAAERDQGEPNRIVDVRDRSFDMEWCP